MGMLVKVDSPDGRGGDRWIDTSLILSVSGSGPYYLKHRDLVTGDMIDSVVAPESYEKFSAFLAA